MGNEYQCACGYQFKLNESLQNPDRICPKCGTKSKTATSLAKKKPAKVKSLTEAEYKLSGYRFSAGDAFALHLGFFLTPLFIGTVAIEATLSDLRSLYFAIPFALIFGPVFLCSYGYNIGTGSVTLLQRNSKGGLRLTTKKFFGKKKINQENFPLKGYRAVSYVIEVNGGSVWLSGPGKPNIPLFSTQGADGDQEVRLFINAMQDVTGFPSERANL